MATHINMDLFSHLPGVDIPEPETRDLKWKATADKAVEKGDFKWLSKALKRSSIDKEEIWRVAYILSLRAENASLREYLSQDKPLYSYVDRFKPGQFAVQETKYISQQIRDLLTSVFEVRQTDFIKRADYKNIHAQNARRWFLNGNDVWPDTLLERCIHIISDQDVKHLLLLDANSESLNELLVSATKHRDLDFVKLLIDSGANPFYQSQKSFNTALETGKHDIAKYLQDVMNKRVNDADIQTGLSNEKDIAEWQLMTGDTLVRSRALPDQDGYLREYFDFSAGRLRSVQEDARGVHPLFVENFSDIANSVALNTAWEKYTELGGEIDRDTQTPRQKIQTVSRVASIKPVS